MRQNRKGKIGYSYFARSEVGLVRTNNEDALLLAPEAGLFGVCDGLGGHAGGEVASALASEVLLRALQHPGQGEACRLLAEAINEANRRIMEEQSRNRALVGMGTTLSAVWIGAESGNRVAIAHIGDSRVYGYRKGVLNQLTEDHSPVFALYKKGLITREEMRRHPHKGVIDRCLGIYPNVSPEIFSTAIESHDRLVISTDGLTDSLSDEEISLILREDELETAVDHLIEGAYKAGAPDNVTVVLVEIGQLDDSTLR